MADMHGIAYMMPLLLMVGFLVFIHELGHYWVARCFGIDAEIFSIGFGRAIVSWRDKRNTLWKISVLPFGGYVRFRGGLIKNPMDAVTAVSRNRSVRLFVDASLTARTCVVLAGPLTNLLFTILIFSLLYAAIGKVQMSASIDEVFPGTPASVAGLRAGDTVLSINGQAINQYRDITEFVLLHPHEALHMHVQRSGGELDVTIVPEVIDASDPASLSPYQVRIGTRHFGPAYPVKLSPLRAVESAVGEVIWMIDETFLVPWQMLKGTRPKEKPVGMVSMAKVTNDSIDRGWINLIRLSAIFSLSLGLFNFLPVPVLDGGFLLLFIGEALTGKQPSPCILHYCLNFGLLMILLLGLWSNLGDLAFLGRLDFVRRHFS